MIVLCMLLQRRQEYKKISVGSKGLPRSTDHDLHPDYFTPDQTMCSLSPSGQFVKDASAICIFLPLREKKVAAAGSECLAPRPARRVGPDSSRRLRPAVGQGPPPPPRDCSARPSRCWALAAAPLRMQVSEPGAASLLLLQPPACRRQVTDLPAGSPWRRKKEEKEPTRRSRRPACHTSRQAASPPARPRRRKPEPTHPALLQELPTPPWPRSASRTRQACCSAACVERQGERVHRETARESAAWERYEMNKMQKKNE
ncbi:hypothetical protein PVAP13_4NG077000 [Panicum virgatum]|uniref:Uncharacterized protein n=1 Tax=Panicum virgatum TaxID=38727 RepID=A0A8T0T881_PANVG|nr:hypothetical protein PVAP13_4NG077000 [Panicum virgatum]KAG2605395.1 hypothetical protein PVAP13_4NG077000 [Panicum virgatum]